MGSSFSRHGARIRTKTQSKETKTQKKIPRADCKLAHKTYRTKIYMMHEQFKCHDACSNALKLSSMLVQIHKIGLKIEVLTKTPKI